MYSNPSAPGVLLVPGGVLATTGANGLSSLGIAMLALGLVVSGALLLRTAYLKRADPVSAD